MPESDTILELLLRGAATWPDRPLVKFEGGVTWTWQDSLEAGRSAAAVLAAQGVGPGDRVMILLSNGPGWIRTWWGATLLGAVIAPVNPAYRGQMLTNACERIDPTVVVAEEAEAQNLSPHWARRQVDPALLCEAGDLAVPPTPVVLPSDPHCLLLTSGTTGPSKASISTHAYFCGVVDWLIEGAGLTEKSVFQADLPWFHLSAFAPSVQMLRVGGTIVVRRSPAMSTYWRTAKELGSTFAVAPGTVAQYLESRPVSVEDRDHSMEFLLAAPLPSDAEGFIERFGLRGLCTAYGSTETSMVITKVIDQSVPAGSCGTVRAGFHARVIDDEGRDVPPGTIGELIVRSDERILMSLGYQGDTAATEAAWRDGWYHTGDAVSADADGFYYFHDRYKDSLRRRGENISSFEVEREVLAFPGIDEVACVAHPGEYAGDDEVKVFIVPEPGREIRLAEVVEFLGERLPAFMQPRYLELADALPKTPTSRVRKHLLRDQGNSAATYDRLSSTV
ncbi:AMP-binding protein [Mycolicibacterium diernhoferi]|uniref:ATP-dependent acyl-CoA ligase n=1 Tax=Mycolicibacterium diernhoferi TaxID=1801 RepID=A0A1Q4HBU4_9MYCO|nr:AMP-binding protein [Mycolicibacterium diernhoferi]OJZ64841.1 hypothetical protein BRW64_16080 [Mycolicibacterium diernhoferi]OPE53810.1 hypothetical protein BV510_13580 [Mycolicibacterium diernhoferi]PEG51546.1 hypothetical protein CRI78_26220 [Mycolicibacterium diernhoferi]QYL22590.1 AMP-binding protein [Mycolicibacterium diernhoferi]